MHAKVILIIRSKRQPPLEESLSHLSLCYRFQFILIARAISSLSLSHARNARRLAYKTGPGIQLTLHCVITRSTQRFP